MLRLGWAHGDQEFFTLEELDQLFSIKGIGKSPSRFDFTKLENMNGHYIRQSDDTYLASQMKNLLAEIENGDWYAERWDEAKEAQLVASMPGLKERAKTLLELLDGSRFIFQEMPLPMEEKAASILDADEAAGRSVVSELASELDALDDWSLTAIEELLRDFTERKELKLGKVAQPLRAALTGRTTSPGIFDVVWVLGREEAVARMRAQAPS